MAIKPSDLINFAWEENDTDALGSKRTGTMQSKFRDNLSKNNFAKVSLAIIRAASTIVDLSLNTHTLVRGLKRGGIGVANIPREGGLPDRYLCGEFLHEDGYVYIVLFSFSESKFYFVRTIDSPGSAIVSIDLDTKKAGSSYPFPVEYILATLWEIFYGETEFNGAWFEGVSAPLKKYVRTGKWDDFTPEKRSELFGLLTDNVYYRLKNVKGSAGDYALDYLLQTPGNGTVCYSFDNDFMDSLEIDTVLLGNFSLLRASGQSSTSMASEAALSVVESNEKWFTARRGKYTLNPDRVLSSEEQALIPHFDGHFTPNKDIARIAKILSVTPDIRDLEFCGPAGGGKSVGAKMLAYMLGVPYRVFTCSPGLDESDLFGHYTPSTSPTTTRNLSSATYQKCVDLEGDPMSVHNIARKILKFPPLGELKKDPRKSFQLLCGDREPSEVELSGIYLTNMYYQRVAEERERLLGELREKSEKSLVFVKSPIVKALENGDLVEVQEQNALSPGTLLGFNDLRDRNSNGYQLPNGEMLYRNPNAVMVMTSNVEYEGCRPMNSSVVSRTGLSVAFPALSAAEMAARAAAVTGYPDLYELNKMASFILEVKNAMITNAIDDGSDIGVRELINWCYVSMAIKNVYFACFDTVINKASYLEENREIFRTLLKNSSFMSKHLDYDEEEF